MFLSASFENCFILSRHSIVTDPGSVTVEVLKIQLVVIFWFEIATDEHFWFQDRNKAVFVKKLDAKVDFSNS